MRLKVFSFMTAVVIAAGLVACGGGKKTTSTSTTTVQSSPAASAPASPVAAQASPAAAPPGAGATVAPVPAKLSCGSQEPVWANTRTHVYHLSTDPLYGRTRHGQYMCQRAAVNAGYREAGQHARTHRGKSHASPGAMAQPSPSP
jgi:hypothetical protein